MSINIKTEILEGGIAVVYLDGRITLGEASKNFRDSILNLIANQQKKIVLDLSSVGYVDSSGLGELVTVFMRAENTGGEIVLSRLGKKVVDLLQITKLFTVFRYFESVEDAAAYLRGTSATAAPNQSLGR